MLSKLRSSWQAVLRPVWSSRGQIAIPALFVIPSLFLFLYLIFETAKISREKIRHQFALDAAAFIEMTNYSDFLNRSAYVNGAFPQRIFHEGFYNTCIEKKNNTQGDCGPQGDRLYDILYKNGAFPRTAQAPPDQPLDAYPKWFLRFGGCGAGKNQTSPNMSSCGASGGEGKGGSSGGGEVDTSKGGGVAGGGRLDLITMQDALDYWISWDDAQDIYKLYVQIYTLLGSVEDAQFSVFKRLTSDHNFFRKSYWLNTNDPINDGYDGARWFDNYQFEPHPHCVQEIMIYGNKPTNNAFQPYQIWAPNSAITMKQTIAGCQPSAGLFQLEAISDSHLNNMRTVHPMSNWPGYPIIQHWDNNGSALSSNYFNVDFHRLVKCDDGGGPCVHATIALDGGSLWPNPTPKFQTRLFP